MLNINALSLSIHGKQILKDVSLTVEKGQIVSIVGESGSGKSMTASAIMQLMPEGASAGGFIWLNGQDLLKKTEKEMCQIRRNDIGMIFQEPMTALNPVQNIGDQVMEAIKLKNPDLSKAELHEKAEFALYRVGLDPDKFPLKTFPHKLSGGQRQRVVIAIAIAQSPKLLIADEPTTALDVTTQAQIMALLKKLVQQDEMGLLLISHDLGVVAEVSDHIVIMRHGEVVEEGDTETFFTAMQHDYSKELVKAAKQVDLSARDAVTQETILEVSALHKDYHVRKGGLFGGTEKKRALNDVSFTLRRGENLGLVGESGCGKSTLSRVILGLEHFDQGEITIAGEEFTGQKELRRHINIVFQDPYGSFNPRHKVERIIAEPFYLTSENVNDQRVRVEEMLELVGLNANDADKYPHQFSGGQRQRIAIARALITKPSVIILDEATSALDVLIRDQILGLLKSLSEKLDLSYLFISHDLSTVKNITDRVLVMKDGEIVEEGETDKVYHDPKHAYTKSLLEASPDIDKALEKKRSINP